MVEVIVALTILFAVVLWFGQEFFQSLLSDLYAHRKEMKELDQSFEKERTEGLGDLLSDN